MTPSLTLHPIGFIRSPKQVKFQARHQPLEAESDTSVLELVAGQNHELALRDLAGFSRIWLVWWFHRNTTWRPLVLPPRGPAQRRGVFATRSPHRPNPLGLTPVQLLAVERRRLILGPCDLVDGTPVFDIKPYIPAYDAFPDAKAGWHDEVDAALQAPPRFTVQFSALATEQAEWLLAGWGVDFRPRMTELLSRDPSPHRSRRIRRRGHGARWEIGCGAWRGFFQVEDQTVTVLTLDAAYPLRFLNDLTLEDIPDRAAQLAFLARWPTDDEAAD
jgi:tRNA-Thr(GGU) m(6)t(6)A37 methyltransferase TsaA